MDPDVITDAIFVVVPSAIVGTRAYYVISIHRYASIQTARSAF